MADVNDWDTVDANNNAAAPDGWPEGMNYSEVNDAGRQVQGAVARYYGDINGTLIAGGVANVYTVSLNAPYSSYFSGMYFACVINASNTGASTMNVNALGAVDITNRDGSALPRGILDAGGIYEFRYDGTNFQLMGTLGSDVAVTQATIANPNNPDLVDTDVGLRIGAENPDVAPHVEIGVSAIEAKADATVGATLLLSAQTGQVYVGGGADHNDPASVTIESAPGFDTGVVMVEGGQVKGLLNYDASDNELELIVQNANEPVTIRTSAGTTMAQFRANSDVALWYNGLEVVRTMTNSAGGLEIRNTATGSGFERALTESDISGLTFAALNDTNTAGLLANDLTYWDGSDWVPTDVIKRETGGIAVRPETGDTPVLSLETAGGTQNAALLATPSLTALVSVLDQDIALQFNTFENAVRAEHGNDVALFDNGTEVARTLPAGSGGFEANNTSTGSGFERVLTESDLGATVGSKVVVDSVLASDITSVSTATTLAHTLAFGAGSSGVLHTYEGVMFALNGTAGVNPGARFHLSDSTGNYNENYGVFNASRSDNDTRQSLNLTAGDGSAIVTGIEVGNLLGLSMFEYRGVLEPAANNQSCAVRVGQNVTNAGQATVFAAGATARLTRWS